MKYLLFQGDCLERIEQLAPVKCIFADPPDNIDLGYGAYKDKMPEDEYLKLMYRWLNAFTEKAEIVWWSFNAKWTVPVAAMLYDLCAARGDLEVKPCVQVFTFGQHNKHDLGNNHRPLWRIMRKGAKLYPDAIKVPSWRQRNGDKRAAPGGRVPGDVFDMQPRPWLEAENAKQPGRKVTADTVSEENVAEWLVRNWEAASSVPADAWPGLVECMRRLVAPAQVHSGDVFDFPRVTGNSAQRCDWHPTQLHEELVKRCVLLSTSPTDRTVDPFGGTGTTLRVCKALERPCTLFEIDHKYCHEITKANGLKVLRTPGGFGA